MVDEKKARIGEEHGDQQHHVSEDVCAESVVGMVSGGGEQPSGRRTLAPSSLVKTKVTKNKK